MTMLEKLHQLMDDGQWHSSFQSLRGVNLKASALVSFNP